MHDRESAHTYRYDWEKKKNIQMGQNQESLNGF